MEFTEQARGAGAQGQEADPETVEPGEHGLGGELADEDQSGGEVPAGSGVARSCLGPGLPEGRM